MAGTSTAALCIGGYSPAHTPPPTNLAVNEQWNGTSWTEVGDLNRVAYGGAAFGTTTAAIYGGGSPPDEQTLTEQWNGTSWTEVNDLNTGRYHIGYGTTGTTSSGIAIAGRTTTQVAVTEEWDGAGTYKLTLDTD